MTFGLCCSQPACRPHPASLPVCVPAVESLLRASFSFASRLRLAFRYGCRHLLRRAPFISLDSARAGHTGAGYPARGPAFQRVQPPRKAAGRGRDDGCPPPPAQTRARAPNAHGSHLGNRHARPVLGPHALPKDWSCRECLARCPASAQCSGISLADRLPSMRSANGSPPLFAHFAGTMQSLDSPPPYMEDLWLIAFSSRPAHYLRAATGSPGSRA